MHQVVPVVPWVDCTVCSGKSVSFVYHVRFTKSRSLALPPLCVSLHNDRFNKFVLFNGNVAGNSGGAFSVSYGEVVLL